MSEDSKDKIIQDFATNLIRLGNECRDWAAECKDLKAEVERLTALIESNLNSSKVMMGKADAVLHERDNLKAEVERLKNNCEYLDQKLDEEIDKSAMLCGHIEQLRKAGTEMGKHLPDTDEANRAYIDFEAGGKPTE